MRRNELRDMGEPTSFEYSTVPGILPSLLVFFPFESGLKTLSYS